MLSCLRDSGFSKHKTARKAEAPLLFARLIHIHQSLIPIIRALVDFQHVFHRTHKLCALSRRYAPTPLQVGLEFVFFNTPRTVSVLMVSTISHSTN